MQILKTIALAVSFLVSVVSAASALPPCPSDTDAVWTNCFGADTFPDGEKYVGGWKDNQRNGQGTFTWPDGQKYIGEFKDDEMNGQGIFTWPNGQKYIGEFKDGKGNGQGTQTFSSGQKYVGEWKDHVRNGQGTHTWPSGQKYLGQWKDHVRNGQGTQTFSSGQKYIGQWKDDKVNGQGYYVWPDGAAEFCDYIDGKGSNCFGTSIDDVAPALKAYFSPLLNSQRKDIQRKLGSMGYYESAIDGFWSRETFIGLVTYAGLELNTVLVRGNTIASKVIETLLPDAPPQAHNSNESYKVASGTGFYVSAEGHIITNNHVIDGCKEIKIHLKGKVLDTVIIATDPQNDLALLKSDEEPAAYFPVNNENPHPLQDVIVAGFPFGDRVSSSLKFTQGIISAMSGIGDNYSQIQIDAALQPGNSGGPILDKFGNVIAVAVSKLDMKKILDDYGVIPEDTNFGVKASAVRNLMEGNRIDPKPPSKRTISKQELSELATDATVFLTCWMTTAQIDQLKTRKVLFNQFE